MTKATGSFDDESGTDRNSFLFLSSSWTGTGWTPWALVSPRPGEGRLQTLAAAGRLYRFKATAEDAAGNVGESRPVYLRIENSRNERRTILEVRQPAPRPRRRAAEG